MTHRSYAPATPVSEVVVSLLTAILPLEPDAAMEDLFGRASKDSAVRPHMHKRWGDLSKREQLGLARAVGLAARDGEPGHAIGDSDERAHPF